MASVKEPEPRVSIGMPVYNGEHFLRQAIDSILAQTFTDFEVIISDNASTDTTAEICRDYVARDARVRYIAHAVNRGAAWNINHVVTLARAPYFTWAHADDMRAPRHLESCIAEFDRAPSSAVVVCSRSVHIDEHNRQIELYQDGMDLRQHRPSDRLRLAIWNVGPCNVVFGLIRTHVLRACRPLGGYPYSDFALINELAVRGQFWEIPEYLFYRRRHPESSIRPGRPFMDAAIWLDPQNDGRLILPSWRVLVDTLRVIDAAVLSWSEALRCRVVLLREFLPLHWRGMFDELKYAARTWLRRFRDKDGIASSDRRWHRRLSAPRRSMPL